MKRRKFCQLGLATGITAPMILTQARAQGAGLSSIVNTRSGQLQGYRNDSVEIFKGIPYGEEASGSRRFMPPVPKAAWRGVRNATVFGTRSAQLFRPTIPEIGDALTGTGPMSEDSLKLNVWTPDANSRTRKPVLIWYHGGGFRTGSGNSPYYDGEQLARYHDMVVVTITHRINALGFMLLNDAPGGRYEASANLGMQDILLALQWVRDNIENLGGDPDNITISGQSGGGGKTSMLHAMPQAQGMFHKAIIMSTLTETSVVAPPLEEAIEARDILLSRLGVRLNNTDALHEMPWEVIVHAMGRQGEGRDNADISARFNPHVDGSVIAFNPFDPVSSPLTSNIPVLTGSNETEGVPYGNPNDEFWQSEPGNDQELTVTVARSLRIPEAEAREIIELFRVNRPDASHGDLALIINAESSAARHSSYIIAERKAEENTSPCFLYLFQWDSPVMQGKLRSMHCMEIPFFFDHIDNTAFMNGRGREQYTLAWKMAQSWSAFTHTGNPSHEGIPNWPAFNKDTWPTMIFGNNTRLENDPYGQERRAISSIVNARA